MSEEGSSNNNVQTGFFQTEAPLPKDLNFLTYLLFIAPVLHLQITKPGMEQFPFESHENVSTAVDKDTFLQCIPGLRQWHILSAMRITSPS